MRRTEPQIRAATRPTGFTITEMLLVVTIIALVGGIGGGMYASTYKRLLVEKAARQFLVMARYARIMAVERQRAYELQLSPEGFALMTTQLDTETGRNEKTIVRDYYCRPVELAGDVRFEDVRITTMSQAQDALEEEQQVIVFLPNGSSASAVVQIGDGSSHFTVAVLAATGKATLYEGTAENVETGSIDLDLESQ